MDEDLNDLVEELLKNAERVYISKDPEEPFILIDRGSEGLAFIAPRGGDSSSVVEIPLDRVASLDEILQDSIGGYVDRDAILTIGCGSQEEFYAHSWDVRRRGRRLYYGYNKFHYLLLIARIYWCLSNWGQLSLILRSFTGRVDRRTGLPIKQIRGFMLFYRDGLRLEKVSLEDLIEAETTDPETGEKLPPEPAVEYCYEYSCISSENL